MTCNYELKDGIAHIHIDDGKVNAINAALLTDLLAAFDKAQADKAIVVLYGKKGLFSAGFDLKTFLRGPDPARELLRLGIITLLRILHFPFPVVTFCEGHAYPGGAFLMLCSDVRIALDGEFVVGMNETEIGLDLPDYVLALAKHRLNVSGQVAISTARMFNPAEGKLAGYYDFVGNQSEIEAYLEATLARLRKVDKTAFKSTKLRMNKETIEAIKIGAQQIVGDEVL